MRFFEVGEVGPMLMQPLQAACQYLGALLDYSIYIAVYAAMGSGTFPSGLPTVGGEGITE